jgi:hypothetical protein
MACPPRQFPGERQLPARVQIIRAGPHIARGLGSNTGMYRYGFGRRRERFDGRRWRPRSRAVGCLLWIVLLIVILVVLALAFGGFQKGTKYNSGLGAGPPHPALRIYAE